MNKVFHFFNLKGIALILGLWYCSDLQAQHSVGIGTTDPNPNAVLDLESDHQGILVPRLRTNQRVKMAEVLQASQGNDGMIVFDIEQGKFYYWFEDAWREGLGILTSSKAKGDLNGTLPAPTVAGLQGRAVAAVAPDNNQVLKWNGTAWTPAKDIGIEFSAGDGIQITGNQITNKGDINGDDDILKTDVAGGDLTGSFDNLSIKDNAVNTGKITDAAITTAKIADQNITTLKIADKAVTLDKIKEGAANTFLSIDEAGVAQWESKAALVASELGEGKILIGNTANVAEGRSISGDLIIAFDGQATIVNNSIDSDKIIDGSIKTIDIADGAINKEKISPNAVTTDKIQDNTIADADLNKTAIPLSGFGAAQDDVDLGNQKLVNVADPVLDTDATNKVYVDNKINSATNLAEGSIYVGNDLGKASPVEASVSGNILVGDGTTVKSVAVSGDASLSADGTVTILNNAITSDKIKDGAITEGKIADGAVGLDQIKAMGRENSFLIVNGDGEAKWFEPGNNKVIVTTNDGQIFSEGRSAFATSSLPEGNIFLGNSAGEAYPFSASQAGRILIGNGTTLSSVPISGDIKIDVYGKTTIQNDSVTSAKIDDGTIITTDLADNAITTNKLLDGDVQTTDLADGSVTNAKLANNAVTTSKVADGVITSDKILDGTIINTDLAVNAVTTSKILDGTIANEDLNKASIPLSGFGAATTVVDLGGQKLTNVAEPVDAQDAVTKAYVDALGTADGDKDATNESLTQAVLDGTDLKITESGSVTTVDLSYLDNTGTDDQQLSLTDNSLGLEDGGSVDLSPYLDNTDEQDLALTGNSLSLSGDATTVDLSGYLDNTDDQNLGSSKTGNAVTVTIDDGASATFDVSDGDSDATNESLTQAVLDGTDLKITESGSLTTVDLSYLDNTGTDDQKLSITDNSLGLEDGGSVDLSPYLDNTDEQDLALTGNSLSLSGDATPVDLSGYLDNTDDQNLGSSKTGNAVTVTIDDGTSATFDVSDGDSDNTNESLTGAVLDGTDLKITESGSVTTVDLSYLDNTGTDDQQLSLTGNSLGLEDGGSVDLSPYLDNTDEQDLALTGNSLSLSGDATTVDLSGYLDNTDDQNLGSSKTGNAVTVTIDDGTSATFDVSDGDSDAANESLAQAVLDGTDLKITESGSVTTVDLSYLDNTGTDDQQLSLTGNSLDLEDGGSIDLSPYLDNTDSQDLSNVLAKGNDANGETITNLAAPTNGSDAATKAYVDALGTADGDKNSTNEIQDLSLTGNSLALSGDATTVDLSGYLDNTDDQDLGSSKTGNAVTVTIDDGASATFDVSDGDSDAANESLAQAVLDGTDLKITESGSVTTVDLSYLDNTGTDDQQLSLTGNSLDLEDGGSVDLSPYLDNTDEQDLALTGNSLSLSGDATPVDLSGYLDNTDDQNLGSSKTGNAVTVTIDDGTSATFDVSDGDSDATNESLAQAVLDGTDLKITESGSVTTVDLSYLDNTGTDDQQLSLTGNSLDLEDGGSIDLSPYLDNTDSQDLSNVLAKGNDANGETITNLAAPTNGSDAATKAYVDALGTADGDKNSANEIQDLSLTGNSLSLSGDATPVDLSGYLDNTDAQDLGSSKTGNAVTVTIDDGASATFDVSDGDSDATNESLTQAVLDGTDLKITESGSLTTVDLSYLDNTGTDDQQLSLTGNSLDLEDGGSIDLSPYLDNTDSQDLSNVLAKGNDANGETITNLAAPTNGSDAATKAYVDALGTADGDKNSTNEIQDLSLTGNSLALSGDATPVDLSGYLDNTDDQNLGSSKTGNAVTVTIDDGTSATFDVSDGDSDNTNESLTGAVLDGTDLKITESGDETTVDLSSLVSSGTRGSLWRQGIGAPSILGTELNEDKYLDTNNGEIWNYNGSVWVNTGQSIQGPEGEQGPQGIPGVGLGSVSPGDGIAITGGGLLTSPTIDVIADETTIGFTGNDGDTNRKLKILEGGIGSDELANNAVLTNKIQNGAVTGAKINQMSATNGQALKWNGTTWAPADDNVDDADADAANEIQSLSISGNNVQISDGNAIPLSATTPTENQVLTWQSGVWKAATVSTGTGVTTKTSYYSVDPLDFVGLLEEGNKELYYKNGYVATSSEDGIAAPVHLPHGAVIESITFYYYDGDAEDMTFTLQKKLRNNGTLTPMATYTSSGASGEGNFKATAITDATIDNSANSYRIFVDLDKSPQHRVYSVVIEYTEEVGGVSVPPGAALAKTYAKPGTPDNNDGENGNFYLDETNNELYVKINGNWIKIRTL